MSTFDRNQVNAFSRNLTNAFPRGQVKSFARGLLFAASAIGLSACSSTVDRFADYPPVKTTASVPAKSPQADTVTRQRLSGSPAQGAVRPSWQSSTPSYNAPKRTASYTPQAKAPAYRPATNGSITVRSGQTMYSLARANGLSVSQLASANNISYPYSLRVGQRLSVPGVNSPTSPAPSFTPRSQQPAYRAASAPAPKVRSYNTSSGHIVRPGETLFSLGRTYGMNPYSIARHNGLSAPYGLNVGQNVRIPGKSAATVAKRTTPVTSRYSKNLTNKPVQIVQEKATDRISPAPVQKITRSEPVPMTTPVANSTFRWPVKGRVISSYGRKSNGLRNEGINISVPEGTSVRAADGGVVAYAGNELKGYGNLVLVRHKNGWVTAYAHNKDLFVKRGDIVKRGAVIAKAGQTGSVKSPQLHFEVRKGSTAVDPMKYLSSQTAAAN